LKTEEQKITLKDIEALSLIVDLITQFNEKIIIKRRKFNHLKFKKKISHLKHLINENRGRSLIEFLQILKKLESIIKKDVIPDLYYIIGGHGGIIIDDIGFCEFDSPLYALEQLLKKMELAIKTEKPYNLEVAVCCLEWLNKNYPEKFSKFLKLFSLGKFEIINPTYSQPYCLIIGPESNLKQFEYGLKALLQLGLHSKIYYCSECSIHPQIPQILNGFNIKYGSLRTRLLGISPTSASAKISWKGLDNSSIDALIDQSGVFNGEYWHGMFFKELPNLLFQIVARPFMDYILYSSIDDFIMPQPYQEEIWQISKFSNLFGQFVLCSNFMDLINKGGEFKYRRDDFYIGDNLFIPSEVFLQNKNSEINIILAEIFNLILGFYTKTNNDSFLENLWRKLLLTQAHDCYAVPFIKSGDYSQLQFTKEVSENQIIDKNQTTISELSIQIKEEIQKESINFVYKMLKLIVENLYIKETNLINPIKSIIVFNPTPYKRRDVVSFQSDNSNIKFIADVPELGYKIYTNEEINNYNTGTDYFFLYNIKLLDDHTTIQIKDNEAAVYELQFNNSEPYELILKEQYANNIEEVNLILGKSKKEEFEIKITQYKGLNRLEFSFNANSPLEIILLPKFTIKSASLNYPFGIEETKRTKIQTLDFLWLRGTDKGIIYVQKSSQKFLINHENFEIRNIIKNKGNYEFSISIINENESISPLFYVNSYFFGLFGLKFERSFEIDNSSESFISFDPTISLINLWRRKDGYYMRLFNPTNEEMNITLSGSSIKNQLKELDFNYNLRTSTESNELTFRPWEIKTIQI